MALTSRLSSVLAAFLALAFPALAQQPDLRKDAEPATRAVHADVLKQLPFDDQTDFEEARRGFVAAIPGGHVGPENLPNWSMKAFSFLDAAEPAATVNPSLWRQARLNQIHGLFKVADRVYQLRGYDISNMTIVEGDTGLIVTDPLTGLETARAALDLYFQHRPRKPVIAVIYSHSHADHFGGVKGVVTEEDVKAGRTKIIAPAHFMEHAVAENVIAGNAMTRRAFYQFGSLLPPGPRSLVDGGLGRTISRGAITLIAPTQSIAKETETHRIDGVDIEFMLTPGTEAPAEMIMYYPQFRVLNTAEIVTRNMHNLYTIRGAEVRDARAWSRYVAETLARYGDRSDVMIAQHHWPAFGRERIVSILKTHRDLYKFIHDQSVRLLNHGYKPAEIAETLKLPPSLAREFSARGYYGTLSHNAKAIYQKYLGWYDANPANLNPLPPSENAKKMVEYMGGAAAVIARAREDFKTGNYRFVATVMDQVVFADPANQEARNLGADALEQMGYQAEAGTWRNAYLTGAMELRAGVPKGLPPTTVNAETLKAVPTDLLFDFIAVRLDPAKAEGKRIVINWSFTDTNEKISSNLENAAMTNLPGVAAADADVSFTTTRAIFDEVLLQQRSFPTALATGAIRFAGNPMKFGEIAGMLDAFAPGFPVVEPRVAGK